MATGLAVDASGHDSASRDGGLVERAGKHMQTRAIVEPRSGTKLRQN